MPKRSGYRHCSCIQDDQGCYLAASTSRSWQLRECVELSREYNAEPIRVDTSPDMAIPYARITVWIQVLAPELLPGCRGCYRAGRPTWGLLGATRSSGDIPGFPVSVCYFSWLVLQLRALRGGRKFYSAKSPRSLDTPHISVVCVIRIRAKSQGKPQAPDNLRWRFPRLSLGWCCCCIS